MLRLGCYSFFFLCCALACHVVAASPPDEPATPQQEAGEYEALLKSLDELPQDEEVDALKFYLERFPNSVHRAEIEERIETLQGGTSPTLRYDEVDEGPANTSTRLDEPLSFAPLEPGRQILGYLSLGAPSWAELLGAYTHPVRDRAVVGGMVGLSEGMKVIEATGQYVLLRTPRNSGLLNTAFSLRGELGQDTRFLCQPRVGYGGLFGPVLIQAFLGPRIRLTGGMEISYYSGVGLGLSLREDWWFGLETTGYIKRVQATRTDLAEPEPTQVSFFYLTVGGRYAFNERTALQVALSFPDWYRFHKDFGGSLSIGFYYRFDGVHSSSID